MDESFEAILAAAVRAPSGDNLQPWRFSVDSNAGRIAVSLDTTRDQTPMNAGQRMSRLAVGGALENLCRAARNKGWTVESDRPRSPEVAAVRIGSRSSAGGELDPAMAARATNRRRYDGRPAPDDVLDTLRLATLGQDGVETHWIHDPDRLEAFAALVGRGDALMFGQETMRRAFLDNVRFDAPWNAEVDEGLPQASLEISAAQRLGLRMTRRIPDRLFKWMGVTRVFSDTARKLVSSSSGLCLIVQEEISDDQDLAAGRAMQRAWLALTTAGLAAQPMMSLPVFENVFEFGDAAYVELLGRPRVEGILDEFRSLAPEIGDGHSAFLMRFGYAAPPTGRTGRFPLEAVIDV